MMERHISAVAASFVDIQESSDAVQSFLSSASAFGERQYTRCLCVVLKAVLGQERVKGATVNSGCFSVFSMSTVD